MSSWYAVVVVALCLVVAQQHHDNNDNNSVPSGPIASRDAALQLIRHSLDVARSLRPLPGIHFRFDAADSAVCYVIDHVTAAGDGDVTETEAWLSRRIGVELQMTEYRRKRPVHSTHLQQQVSLTRAALKLRLPDNLPTYQPMAKPGFYFGEGTQWVSEWVESNAPPDTIQVISEADTPWESCTSPIQ